MTAPAPKDPVSPMAAFVSAISALSVSALDEVVPDNEHAAITMSMREWIVLSATVNTAMKRFAAESPLALHNELIKRGMAAVAVLERKIATASEATAARLRRERGEA